MNYHQKNVHQQIKPFKCDTCGSGYTRLNDVVKHINEVHKKERNFYCDICEKSFVRNWVLKKHNQVVHQKDQIEIQCDKCPKTFKNQNYLKKHKEIHKERQKKFVCTENFCNASFYEIKGLNQHVNEIHKNIKSHKCGSCYKMFSRKWVLKVHFQKNHAETKVAESICDICDKKFADLENHMINAHTTKDGRYICNFCGATYFKLRDLKGHKTRLHNSSKLLCDICDLVFQTNLKLKEHMSGIHGL